MIRFFFLLQFFLFLISLQAQSIWNINEVGHLSNDSSSSGVVIRASDIWGYVDSSGTEYALIGKQNGLSIVSLVNPTQPMELFFLPGNNSNWRDIKTYGDYAYVCNESGGGIKVVDLGGLPDTVIYQDTMLAGIETAHNLWIDNDWLYICGTPTFGGGIGVFSLANPWFPNLLGQYNSSYIHDLYARDSIAYAAEIYQGNLLILAFSQPDTPLLLGQTTYPNALTHNTWLNDAGNVCFTTDELNAAYIQSWDISDPMNIQALDRIRSSVNEERGMPHNTHVRNDWLITSYYEDGIHLTDAARPHNLVEVGYFETPGSVWGAYPYLPSGLILASDIWEGLYVLQPTYVRAAYLEGLITDSLTGQPLADARIEVLGQSLKTKSLTNGQYALGTVQNGIVDVRYSKYGYKPQTLTLSLSQAQLTSQAVALAPANELGNVYMYVSDSLTGAGIPTAQVLVEEVISGNTFVYKEGEDAALFDGLFAGNYTVYAGAWGYQTRRWEVFLDGSNNAISLRLLPAYYDDFLFDFGWEVQSTTQPGTWEWDHPLAGYINDSLVSPAGDIAGDFGDRAYLTQNSLPDGTSIGVRNGQVQLTSPWMNLADYEDPIIHYQYWFCGLGFSFGQGFPTTDSLAVFLVTPPEVFQVAEYSGYMPYWQEDSIRVRDYFPEDSLFQIVFITANAEVVQTVEALVDGFYVQEKPQSTALEADFSAAFIVYPNPLKTHFNIRTRNGQVYKGPYMLWDNQGRLLQRGKTEGQAIKCPYPPGLYILQLARAGEENTRIKLLLQP